MAEVRNNEGRFGGQYMIQDRDHMSEIGQSADKANRGGVGSPSSLNPAAASKAAKPHNRQ
jgi:hypothetical protein